MSNEFKNWRVDYQGMGSKTSEVCTVYGITPVKVGDEVQDFAYIVVDGELTAEKRTKALSLINAAPELLGALKDCVAALGGAKSEKYIGPQSALDAIDKAEGRP